MIENFKYSEENEFEALVLLNPNREVDVIRKVGGVDWMKKLLESNVEKSGG